MNILFPSKLATKNDPISVHKIKAFELLNSLKGISEAGDLKKMFSRTHKRQKVLETPLPKHISDKALRIASYIQDKKEVSTWDPIIKKNRTAEQLIFPLKQPDYSMESGTTFSKAWNVSQITIFIKSHFFSTKIIDKCLIYLLNFY